MGIEVTSTTVNASEISSNIRIDFPEGLLTRSQKKQIKDKAGDLLVKSILDRVGKAQSPIRGGRWKVSLSKEYADLKLAAGRVGRADMELTGDMLEALGFVRTIDGIKIQIKGKTALRADGHNNFSGESKLPTRQFLPREGDKFKGGAERTIENLIAEIFSRGS